MSADSSLFSWGTIVNVPTGLGFRNGAGTGTFLATAAGWALTGDLSTSGVSTLANGTAAAPSLAWTNSTGMGLYRVADNVLGGALSGVPAFTLGNVEPTVAAATATAGLDLWVKTANGGASTGATAAGKGADLIVSPGDGGAAAGSGTGGNGGTLFLAGTAGGTSGSGTAGKDGQIVIKGATTTPFVKFSVITAKADADAGISVAELRGQRLTMATGANDRTLTLPTAAQIVAAIPGLMVGSELSFSVTNLKAANTCTVAVASGITAPTGTNLVVAAVTSKTFTLVFTNVGGGTEAATLLNTAG